MDLIVKWLHQLQQLKSMYKFLIAVSVIISTFYFSYFRVVLYEEDIIFMDGSGQYLVHSSKCAIPNINPFNNEVKNLYVRLAYTPCGEPYKLTYTTKNADNTKATLHVNRSAIDLYTTGEVRCCISDVLRPSSKSDTKVEYSPCRPFEDNVTLAEGAVLVKCNDSSGVEVYKNTHFSMIVTEDIARKIRSSPRKQKLSVLIIGLDSLSQLNFIRTMPLSRDHLLENDWIEYKGYNKVGLNTFPNVMAFLTGRNYTLIEKFCNPKFVKELDKCNFLFYNYSNNGYITSFAEDNSLINTFTYLKKGFYNEPVDYYLKPYSIASDALGKLYIDGSLYCSGPEVSMERILNTATDFTATFRDAPFFGLYWVNGFHDYLNAPSRMDAKLLDFLEKLKSSSILNSTIVFLLSDHGLRFGKILRTRTGWYEERLPMLYMSVPKWFQTAFPGHHKNLRDNAYKLTSTYDLHMTLQDILSFSSDSYKVVKSESCPTCTSFFGNVPTERSCSDAGIDSEWCTCRQYTSADVNSLIVRKGARHVVDAIHQQALKFAEGTKCAKFSLKKIINAQISQNAYSRYSYLVILVETIPQASFEATVKLDTSQEAQFKVEGSVNRIDKYGNNSDCVSDYRIKPLCYCL